MGQYKASKNTYGALNHANHEPEEVWLDFYLYKL